VFNKNVRRKIEILELSTSVVLYSYIQLLCCWCENCSDGNDNFDQIWMVFSLHGWMYDISYKIFNTC